MKRKHNDAEFAHPDELIVLSIDLPPYPHRFDIGTILLICGKPFRIPHLMIGHSIQMGKADFYTFNFSLKS